MATMCFLSPCRHLGSWRLRLPSASCNPAISHPPPPKRMAGRGSSFPHRGQTQKSQKKKKKTGGAKAWRLCAGSGEVQGNRVVIFTITAVVRQVERLDATRPWLFTLGHFSVHNSWTGAFHMCILTHFSRFVTSGRVLIFEKQNVSSWPRFFSTFSATAKKMKLERILVISLRGLVSALTYVQSHWRKGIWGFWPSVLQLA